jgi:sugar/nucleoside kinase (ribokinase family)
MRDVAILGEALGLFVAREGGPLEDATTFDKGSAGAETNVAVGLARLGHRVGWASRLGDDSIGRFLLATFRAEGIDCSQVVVDPAQRSGLMFKGRRDDGGDPPIEYHRAGSAASRFRPLDIDAAWLTGARHLHLTGIFAALSSGTLAATERAITLMRASSRNVSFDPNLRPALWPSARVMRDTVNHLAEGCDWLLPGLAEGRLLTGLDDAPAIAAHYRRRGARAVVVKLGADGVWFDGEAGSGHVPAVPVARVVDTVGAGDGFAVGLISGLLEGLPLRDAARRGAWIGARAVQVRGDTEGLPTRAELLAAGLP